MRMKVYQKNTYYSTKIFNILGSHRGQYCIKDGDPESANSSLLMCFKETAVTII